jgi:hypothetical protein
MSSEDNAPLPPEAVNKIKLFLVAFNKLGIGISIERYGNPLKGGT